MYIPQPFEETDISVMQALIRDYPLATLVTFSGDGLNANHIPLHLQADENSPYGCLCGHVARSTPLCGDIPSTEVLAVFQAENAYISPSWYATKAQTGKVVPTWKCGGTYLRRHGDDRRRGLASPTTRGHDGDS